MRGVGGGCRPVWAGLDSETPTNDLSVCTLCSTVYLKDMHATSTAAHTAVILSFPVWPVGMPLCRPLGEGLWEVRSTLPSKRIARVIFCFADDVLVALHGFIKKTQKTSPADFTLARYRMKEILQ